MFKCVAVSDLHGRLPVIPECDFLFIGGDVMPDAPWAVTQNIPRLEAEWQERWMATTYRDWEQSIFKYTKIFATLGNHDWATPSAFPSDLRTRFLIDKLATVKDHADIDQLSVYGTPWIAPCGGWNYEKSQRERAQLFNKIPRGLDVLISHGPMRDVMDQVYIGDHVGCPELRRVVQEKRPTVVIHGHIHEGQKHGRIQMLGTTMVINAAMWGNEWVPVEFDI